MDPLFLDLWEIVRIHEDQIARYGGAPGIRDANLLASAVAMPRASKGDMAEFFRRNAHHT